jgi:tetratricopeptide (TPR) repeat protein
MLLSESRQDLKAQKQWSYLFKNDKKHNEKYIALAEHAIHYAWPHKARLALSQVKSEPQSPLANHLLYLYGQSFEREKRGPMALQAYQNISPLSPQYYKAQLHAAFLLSDQEKHEDAIKQLTLLSSPYEEEQKGIQLSIAEIYYYAENAPAAIEALTRWLHDDPGDPDYLYARSLHFESQNDLIAAEDDLQTILKGNPTHTEALCQWTLLLINHHFTTRQEEALSLLMAALVNNPQNPLIMNSLGWYHYKDNNAEEAYKWPHKAHQHSGFHPLIAAHFGALLWQKGEKNRAMKIWEEGKKITPHHPILIKTMQSVSGQK